VTATPVYVNDEPQASAIRVSFGQTEESMDEWRGYLYGRLDLEDPLGEITTPSQTSFIDYLPRAGIDLTYWVSQVTEVDGTSRESERVYVTARVDFEGLVWCNALDPTAERLMCEGWVNRGITSDGQDAQYITRGEEAPFTVRTSQVWWNYSATVMLIDYDDVLAAEQEAQVRALNKFGGPICVRDGYSRRDFISIPRKAGVGFEDGRKQRRDLTLKGVSEAYDEGIGNQGDVV
jgi:hypothetical protein